MLRAADFFRGSIPFHIHTYRYDRYDELKMHTHDFIELVYVCEGRGVHQVRQRTESVQEGDLFIINYETPHCFYPRDRHNTDGLTVINCQFTPDFLRAMQIELPAMRGMTELFLLKGLYPGEAEHAPDLTLSAQRRREFEYTLRKMLAEYNDKPDGYEDVLKLQLCELLIQIHRSYKDVYHGQPHPDSYKLSLIRESIHYMRGNLSASLQLTELSQQALLSKSYYSALFKQVTGRSVIDYLQQLRIEEACRLLAGTDRAVSDIAEQVGYADYRFFNKTFQKITGMTASAYRKRVDDGLR
ncbi:AraC family transcriptional regulator [Paenibacillus sp. 598K]|uniref:AraC family transcriptional regulator n=1 Tax=Paenibacillus sp. 598K TaxID=1117987 RepID=UPI000FF98AAE|nr:AraC family transcriptional regulator [Paenibacillus sp. 598K]GBF74129.1 AraC family transcriptional regulator [Paenibacillus sp. 598K]